MKRNKHMFHEHLLYQVYELKIIVEIEINSKMDSETKTHKENCVGRGWRFNEIERTHVKIDKYVVNELQCFLSKVNILLLLSLDESHIIKTANVIRVCHIM